MTSNEIRNSFLKYFEERGHRIVPSAPVIPQEDPTLLFTNAGMNQFKDVFLGTGTREYSRAADSQKCIRASGKHNDLEDVGRDTYHHTFFEMLGNWSFGDYYKKEAIEWAWDLLTRVWGLEKWRLYATVFESDDEALELWGKVTDIDKSHILKFGKKDNFWEMGETGPCGPCSEIHIDLTPDLSGGKLVNAGDYRVMEIWNLVFIQYNRDANGTLTPLPAKHVDTGMGFERICAVLQKKNSNYDTDVFSPVIRSIEETVGKRYGSSADSDIAIRVLADHVRMLSFSIADGGIPSNEGRGYVMRRILRRGARFGRNLGMHEPFIYKIVGSLVQSMGDVYPELAQKQTHIERVIKGEEEGFNETLDRGLEIFESEVPKYVASRIFPGELAFQLSDTYGFPVDLTQMMAKERGMAVDMEKFNVLMEAQKRRSQGERRAKFLVGYDISDDPTQQFDELFRQAAESIFRYDIETVETHPVLPFLFKDKEGIIRGAILLAETTFYAQSGGQVSDTGYLLFHNNNDETRVKVIDVVKEQNKNVHLLDKSWNEMNSLANRYRQVRTEIDVSRRHNIKRNHSATHLVHEALRRVLGTHLHQQGSLVDAEHLRFDFNHFDKVSQDDIRKIEDIVNEKIADGISVYALNDPKDWLTIEQAKSKYPNVKMFFGDKYGDRVRIVEIDSKFSVELCGGTHVDSTKQIGLFKIISESSVSSGIRRIEAVTGDGLRAYIEKRLSKVYELDDQIVHLIEEKEQLEQELGITSKSGGAKSSGLEKIVLNSWQLSSNDFAKVEDAINLREQAVEQQLKATNALKKELSSNRVKGAASNVDSLVASAHEVKNVKLVSSRIEAANMDELKEIGDTLRAKLGSGVGVLGTVIDDKVSFVCVVTDDLVKKGVQAGKIVGEVARLVGGGGGGKPHLATAGGKDVEKLDMALTGVTNIVGKMLQV
jgi:alanyl-tRNA synthetase